jgi:predicted Zn-dependent protease
MKRVLLAIIAAGFSLLASAQDDVRLPDFGSSAASILSPDEERQIGESMLRELRGLEVVIDDPLVVEYIESLGYRLVAQSERPEQPFTFFVLRSEQINAFAAPGGYVGVYAGLVTTAQTESELAAVLGHEVAHVTQRHLVRAFERLRKATLPIALATIGAIIAARGVSGDGAEAALMSGTALMQQQAINFTRHNESEADRIGIHTLAQAGLDPTAMATFFGRMGRALRSNGDQTPEFLRTHPVTVTRVSEAKARAEQLVPKAVPAADPPAPEPGVRALSAAALAASALRAAPAQAAPASRLDPFLMFRERVRVLGGDDMIEIVRQYREAFDGDDAPPRPERLYGYALALRHAGRYEEAVATLRPLVESHPREIAFALALADAEGEAGRRDAARARLAKLAAERPGHRAVTLAWADQLIASGRADAAREAVAALRPVVEDTPSNALLQTSYARALELAGELIRAGEAHAEVALLNGHAEDALKQLTSLLERDDVDYYERARIEARIAEITPLALEERRRGIPPEEA